MLYLPYMRLFVNSYIEKLLKKATYEYDRQTKSWCASVDDLPGAYAQADTKKEVKDQLAEVIEDYILVSLYERRELPLFKNLAQRADYAKANQ